LILAENTTDTPQDLEPSEPKRPSSAFVMTAILDGLMDRTFKPGDRVNARQLAKQLDISIVPVREALHLLAGEGVIELLPLRSARIRTMSREEAANWWKIYRVVGTLGIRGAALNIAADPANRMLVQKAMQRIRDAARQVTPARFTMILLDFHRVIDAFSGVPEVNEAVRRLQVMFWCLVLPDFIPFEDYWDIHVRNYQRIADSIMIGDAETADAAFKYHVAWSIAVILGARPDPAAPWVWGGPG
jgi:DNA-binding GntR family transcriptional regulator